MNITFLLCQICGRQFGTKSLPIHQRQCAERNGLDVTTLATTDIPHDFTEFNKFNQKAQEEYNNNAVATGVKVECVNCKRSFARQEGLEKHQVLCNRSKCGGLFARHTSTNQQKSMAVSEQITKVARPESKYVYVNCELLARFCVKCGLDFDSNDEWKFCPQCGTGRSSIKRR
jgi:hypothetical protein